MLGKTILEVFVECWHSFTSPPALYFILLLIGGIVAIILHETCYSNGLGKITCRLLRILSGCSFSEKTGILILYCIWAAFCLGGIWALPVCGAVLVSGWLTRIVEHKAPPLHDVCYGGDLIPFK